MVSTAVVVSSVTLALAAYTAAHPPSTARYVALGDSYSSGLGAGSYISSSGSCFSVYFDNPGAETAVAGYLNELWNGQHPPPPPGADLQVAFDYWRPAAIVVVAVRQSPVVRVLTRLIGGPAFHIGNVFSWRLFSWRLRG
jgi:hypothetical protein